MKVYCVLIMKQYYFPRCGLGNMGGTRLAYVSLNKNKAELVKATYEKCGFEAACLSQKLPLDEGSYFHPWTFPDL